jgi:hypothetical protein
LQEHRGDRLFAAEREGRRDRVHAVRVDDLHRGQDELPRGLGHRRFGQCHTNQLARAHPHQELVNPPRPGADPLHRCAQC